MLLKLEFLLGLEGGRIEISTPVLFCFFVVVFFGGGWGLRCSAHASPRAGIISLSLGTKIEMLSSRLRR